MTSKVILPGTMSAGITNPRNEATVTRKVGRYVFQMNGRGLLLSSTVKPVFEYTLYQAPSESLALFSKILKDRSYFIVWTNAFFVSRMPVLISCK